LGGGEKKLGGGGEVALRKTHQVREKKGIYISREKGRGRSTLPEWGKSRQKVFRKERGKKKMPSPVMGREVPVGQTRKPGTSTTKEKERVRGKEATRGEKKSPEKKFRSKRGCIRKAASYGKKKKLGKKKEKKNATQGVMFWESISRRG